MDVYNWKTDQTSAAQRFDFRVLIRPDETTWRPCWGEEEKFSGNVLGMLQILCTKTRLLRR